MQKTLISLMGPTAIGKTAMGIQLAKLLDTEIISADSRQFYKEMCIGTAVPTQEELAAVPHHFIQHLSIADDYNVGDFEKDALKKLTELFKIHDTVVMVGGSGLFVKAVSEGLDQFPEVDPHIRKELNDKVDSGELRSLQEFLQQVDSDYASKIDLQNPRRVIRALEVYLSSGKPFSHFLNQPKPKRNFKTLKVGLKAPREIIYDRINRRVDLMMEEGLLKEAQSLYPQRDKNPLNTIGYRELFRYFDGDCSLEFAVSEIKKNTRRFAKRQMTWFRNQEDLVWFEYNDKAEDILQYLQRLIDKY